MAHDALRAARACPLKPAGEQIGDSRKQRFVIPCEGVHAVAVYIYLPENPLAASYQYDDLGASLKAASKIVIKLGDISYNLIRALGHGSSANALAYVDARVLGRLAYEVMKNERVAFEQVYAGPIIMLALLFEDAHRLAQHIVARQIRSDQLLDLVHYIFRSAHLS